jgi:hypothetical protein
MSVKKLIHNLNLSHKVNTKITLLVNNIKNL